MFCVTRLSKVLRKNVVSRSIINIAPWKFKKIDPFIEFDSNDFESIKANLYSLYSEGYIYAFNSICEAYQNEDTELLSTCLEPRLFDLVTKNFEDLSSNGYRFRKVNESDPEISIHNLKLSMGVNINRSENFSRNEYRVIAPIKNFSSQIPFNFLGSKFKSDKLNNFLGYQVLTYFLENGWIYIFPEAPLSLIMSVDVMFKANNPLTLIKDDKDEIYDKSMTEVHILKFECEIFRHSTQKELVSLSALDKLRKVFESSLANHDFNWVISDIDNALMGNPYVFN